MAFSLARELTALHRGRVSQVAASLRRLPLVWDALCQEDFFQAAAVFAGDTLSKWSPGGLCLLALGAQDIFDSLPSGFPSVLPGALRRESAAALERFETDGRSSFKQADLRSAGLVALGLAQRLHRKAPVELPCTGDWPSGQRLLETAVAAAYTLSPTGWDWIVSLARSDASPETPRLGFKAVLSNPLTKDEQLALLSEMLSPLTPTDQLGLLPHLAALSLDTCRGVASRLAEAAEPVLAQPESPDQIGRLLHRANLLQLAGRLDEVIPLLERASEVSRRVYGTIAVQVARAAAESANAGLTDLALARAESNSTGDEELNEALVTARLHSGRLDPRQVKRASGSKENSVSSLARLTALAHASMLFQNEEAARDYALKAYALFGREAQNSLGVPATTPDLRSLAAGLLGVGRHKESIEVCRALLAHDPTDSFALKTLAESLLVSADLPAALEQAFTLMALHPDDLEGLRILGRIQAAAGNWKDSLDAWKRALAASPEAPLEDLLHAAQAALACGDHRVAAKFAQKACHLSPESAPAHLLLGRCIQALGDHEGALEHFVAATELDPALPEGWLALAEQCRSAGDSPGAIEALGRGLENAGACADLYLVRGELHLEAGGPAEARADLEAAHRILTEETSDQRAHSPEAFLRLAQAFSGAGDDLRANSLLGAAVIRFPGNRDLRLRLAEGHLRLGDHHSAYRVLTTLADELPRDLEVHLALLDMVSQVNCDPSELAARLEAAQSLAPESLHLRALKTELLVLQKDGQEALARYKGLLKTRLAKDAEWRRRLVTGMARAALVAGKPELALAALKDNLSESIVDLPVLQLQYEAYRSAGLNENALDVLRQVAARQGVSLPVLTWASHEAQALAEHQLALDLLNNAHSLEPSSAEILVEIGQVWLHQGNARKAREWFSRLLKSQNPSPLSLCRAARALEESGDPEAGLRFLEKALESPEGRAVEILSEMLRAFLKLEDYTRALETADELLRAEPENASFAIQKSSILHRLGRLQTAQLTIRTALERYPLDANLHEHLARLMVANGETLEAYGHILKSTELQAGNAQAVLLAAQLAYCCLDVERAISLAVGLPEDDADAALLNAELALQNGEEITASRLLNDLRPEAAGRPWAMAIQVRLSVRIGQWTAAEEAFEGALRAWEQVEDEGDALNRVASGMALASAAWELHRHKSAIELAAAIAASAPNIALANFASARLRIQAAEWAHLCHALQVVHHAPDAGVLGEASLEAASAALEQARNSAHPGASGLLGMWERRMRWALDGAAPGPDDLPACSNDPDALAAAIAACRRAGLVGLIERAGTVSETSPRPAAQLALACLRDDPLRGLEYCRALLENPQKNPLWFALSAFLARRAGRLTDAAEWITQALAFWPDEPRWHNLAGELRSDLGMSSSAIQHFEQALAMEPDKYETRLALGNEYLMDGAPGNALRVLEPLQGRATGDPAIWTALTEAHIACGDHQDALRCIAAWKKQCPEDPQPLLFEARIAYAQNRFEDGLAKSQAAIAKRPALHAARTWQVRNLVALGRHAEALEAIDESLEANEEPIPLLLERAEIISQLEGDPAALAYLQPIAGAHPDSPRLLSAIANIHSRLGNLPEAIRMCRAALRASEQELPPAQKGRLHVQLAVLLRRSGQLDQALHHLAQATQLAPGLVEAYLESGEIYKLRREADKAVEAYRRAMAVAPQDARAYVAAGDILREGRDFHAAEDMLKRASRVAPDDPNIRRQLGAVIALNLVHNPQGLD